MKILILILMSALSSLAQVNPQLKVGVGLQAVGDYVDVLVKSSGHLHKGNAYYILSFSAEGTNNFKEFTSVNVRASLFKYIYNTNGGNKDESNFYAGFSLIDANYVKNIDIDLYEHHSLTVVGIRAGGVGIINNENNIKLFAHAALGFGPLAMDSERYSDGQGFDKFEKSDAENGSLKLGITFKRFKLTYGVNLQRILNNGIEYFSHVACDDYYDDFGYLYRSCDDVYFTDYAERLQYKREFIELSFKLSSRSTWFARYLKQSYEITDSEGYLDNSYNSNEFFQVGVNYKFGGKKKEKAIDPLK